MLEWTEAPLVLRHHSATLVGGLSSSGCGIGAGMRLRALSGRPRRGPACAWAITRLFPEVLRAPRPSRPVNGPASEYSPRRGPDGGMTQGRRASRYPLELCERHLRMVLGHRLVAHARASGDRFGGREGRSPQGQGRGTLTVQMLAPPGQRVHSRNRQRRRCPCVRLGGRCEDEDGGRHR